MLRSFQVNAGLTCFVLVMTALTRIPRPVAHLQGSQSLLERPSVPAPVKQTLRKACASCHSAETEWPWYSYLPVVSYALERDVTKARTHLDFSNWQRIERGAPEDIAAAYSGICENLLSGAMPKRSYLWMHPEARVDKSQTAAVCAWTDAEAKKILTAK